MRDRRDELRGSQTAGTDSDRSGSQAGTANQHDGDFYDF